MSTDEFNNQFDILYDNIAKKSTSPALDLYEKSVYLTKSQLEYVKNHYSPANKYQEGFEGSEKRRVDLKELVVNFKNSNQLISTNGLSVDSKFFSIPEEVFLIIKESASINNTINQCITNKVVKVVPKTHDEYDTQIDNPFKKPSDELVWRMDYSRQNGNKNVELISPYDISMYSMRYIKLPSPIILTDISDGEFLGEGLSIQGETAERTCELDESTHEEILDRAVQLAARDYNKSNLEAKVKLDERNE